MNKLFLICIFLSLSFLLLFSACSGSKKEENVVVVGTNAEFPPFTYIDKGEIVGFDIDIAKEVVKRMHKSIYFKNIPFDALIAEVNLGHVDFVAAGMTATPERAKRVLFTRPYLNGDPLVIVTLSEKYPQSVSLEALLGKNVVVNEGFTADIFMSSKEGYNLIRLPTTADGFLAVKNGRADAFITADSTVQSFVSTQDDKQFSMTPIDGTNENCALVIAKTNQKLLNEIQPILDEMEKEGVLAAIKSKWKLD